MTSHPLIEDLCTQGGLNPEQARGVAGVLLNKLQERLPMAGFETVKAEFPDADAWMESAPSLPRLKTGGFMPAAMVKAQLLMQMNQALKALSIPSSQATSLGQILKESIRTHHPDLVEQIRPLL